LNINDNDDDDELKTTIEKNNFVSGNSVDNDDDNAYNSTNFSPSVNTHDDSNSRESLKLDVNDTDDNNNNIFTDSVMVNLINVGNETIILATTTSTTTTTTTSSTTTSSNTTMSTTTAVSKMNLFTTTGKRPLSHDNRHVSRGRKVNAAPNKEIALSSRPLSSPSSSSSQRLEKKEITSKV
jgi:hypothetical protein